MGKRVSLLLIVSLTVSGLLMVNFEPASAEVTEPSVPEFTVKLVNYSTIEVTIKNQPELVSYDVRIKRQFSEFWTNIYPPSQRPEADGYPRQSNSNYTVLSFPVSDPYGDQVAVQVAAVKEWWCQPARALTTGPAPWVHYEVTSGWSSIQTLTLPAPSPSPTPQPESSALTTTFLGVVAVVGVLCVGLLAVYKGNKPKQEQAKLSKWQ